MKRNLKYFEMNGRRTHCKPNLQPLSMQESIPRNQELEHTASTTAAFRQQFRSKTCLEEKWGGELTGNHGGRQVGSTNCSSAHGKKGERAFKLVLERHQEAKRGRKRRRLWRWNLHPSPSGSECRRRR